MILSALIAAGCATSALAQTPPYVPPYGAYPGGVPAAIADQHRYENDRLRRQSEANAALARQQQVETRQRLTQIEAAREPTVSPAAPARPLYDVAQERSLREGAAARREQTRQGVSQIDDWLDRPN
ncbi:MAG: hypothetical protein Q7J26_13455 [Brevundimonas sp.]|uniref:hypothetical protein n=1 Tax=Brevundimonas sp. TaxID=1871086 RepID=UPI002728223A|nr:hypothetical protein [Brevundimonas sp.]MDO9609524.1 hypothetical protein [Brevundimonas sp.]